VAWERGALDAGWVTFRWGILPAALRRGLSGLSQILHRSGGEAGSWRGNKANERRAGMRYGFQSGTGSAVAWGLVVLLLGLIGLAFPLLFVAVAVALTARAVVWARRTEGRGSVQPVRPVDAQMAKRAASGSAT
jgi:hypothetical protein